MAFADPKRTESAAHKYTHRVTSIDGATISILWEGDNLFEADTTATRFANEARISGSQASIVLDSFRLDIERRWMRRGLWSRPVSVTPIRKSPGKKGRPRILFMPLELATWHNGAHSWSYAAALAYEAGLRAAGCEVTTINTACAASCTKILRGQRFDQVWFHCHPKHLDDFAFRQWVSDVAPVRLVLCGETVNYSPEKIAAEPWSFSHTQVFEKWAPFVTHAAFVDPSDVQLSLVKNSIWWQQAVPERFVLPVNTRPSVDAALFLGTLYPPRDRWACDLGGLIERVESPESDTFQWLFERSHEWIQSWLDRMPHPVSIGPGPAGRYSAAWKVKLALRLYNRLQVGLRRHAFGNFVGALRNGLAVVALPSMVKTYSGRVVEGMAAGRPVIAQRLDGHPAVFEDGQEILHYSSVDELADHIRRLKAEPETANRIARNARAAILARHTVEIRTAELLRFVEGE